MCFAVPSLQGAKACTLEKHNEQARREPTFQTAQLDTGQPVNVEASSSQDLTRLSKS